MILDIILLVPIGIGMFLGFRKGFILSVCTLMGIALGIYLAAEFGKVGADYLQTEFNTDPRISLAIAFGLLLIGVLVGAFFFGKVLETAVKTVALGPVNKFFGLLFGGFKYALILSCFLFLLRNFPLTQEIIPAHWKGESYLYQPIESLVPSLYPKLKTGKWREKMDDFIESI